MAIDISALAYAFHQRCKSASLPLKLSHCQQLLAAAFGYKTFAAHQAAQATYAEADILDGVDSVLLNQQMLVSRAEELGLKADVTELVSLFKEAFRSCLPGVSIYSEEGLWSEGVREYIVHLVENDSNVIGLIADTNNDGISETYVPFDLSTESVPPAEQPLSTNMKVRITLNIDYERPYAGHIIDVTVDLRINRIGRALWGAPRGHVTHWHLAEVEEPTHISLAQALANAFGLELEEARELEDAEARPIEGSDETVYGYYFDFSRHASPATAVKLMSKFGRLDNLRVGPEFFDQVERSFD